MRRHSRCAAYHAQLGFNGRVSKRQSDRRGNNRSQAKRSMGRGPDPSCPHVAIKIVGRKAQKPPQDRDETCLTNYRCSTPMLLRVLDRTEFFALTLRLNNATPVAMGAKTTMAGNKCPTEGQASALSASYPVFQFQLSPCQAHGILSNLDPSSFLPLAEHNRQYRSDMSRPPLAAHSLSALILGPL